MAHEEQYPSSKTKWLRRAARLARKLTKLQEWKAKTRRVLASVLSTLALVADIVDHVPGVTEQYGQLQLALKLGSLFLT